MCLIRTCTDFFPLTTQYNNYADSICVLFKVYLFEVDSRITWVMCKYNIVLYRESLVIDTGLSNQSLWIGQGATVYTELHSCYT